MKVLDPLRNVGQHVDQELRLLGALPSGEIALQQPCAPGQHEGEQGHHQPTNARSHAGSGATASSWLASGPGE
jgi:hypothetical protein